MDGGAVRLNFEVVSRLVTPGDADGSRLLVEALAISAGGARFHVGGKVFPNRDDPQWRTMAASVSAADASAMPPPEPPPTLDFEFFRTCVQQILQSKRDGRMECVHYHGGGGRGFAQTLPEGRECWNLEESRENFEILQRYIEPGFPLSSRFLTHPLSDAAGGDGYHGGGRHWPSQDHPECQMLAAWVRGEAPSCQVGRPRGSPVFASVHDHGGPGTRWRPVLRPIGESPGSAVRARVAHGWLPRGEFLRRTSSPAGPALGTPHLDRLAAQAMRFTDFCASDALCSALRLTESPRSRVPRTRTGRPGGKLRRYEHPVRSRSDARIPRINLPALRPCSARHLSPHHIQGTEPAS